MVSYVKSESFDRDLLALEMRMLKYISKPDDEKTSVTAEDVIARFAKADEELTMEASSAIAYLTDTGYARRTMQRGILATHVLTVNCLLEAS